MVDPDGFAPAPGRPIALAGGCTFIKLEIRVVDYPLAAARRERPCHNDGLRASDRVEG